MSSNKIKLETLICVLNRLFGEKIVGAVFQTEQLHGGTLGDVQLVSGIATTAEDGKLPYNVVLKIQKKWERYGDPNSWRREYDLYMSDLGKTFNNSFRWPECYHAEINAEENEIQLWTEYIEGISGNSLTTEMLEQAALELGRFQGRLYSQPELLKNLECVNGVDTTRTEYEKWHSENDVLTYLRSGQCPFPKYICEMFFILEQNIEAVFENIEKLPVVFAHKDFWVENIIYSNGEIKLIDWDTTGWGYLGEDIASLIIDETYTWCIEEYYKRLIPAYYTGFSEYADISFVSDNCIRDMILIRFGYRLVRGYQYAKTAEHKEQHVIALQKIYEMKEYQA